MAKYKRYEKYKDSGVEWLQEVPQNWDIVQFRRCTSLNQGLQIPQEQRFYEYGENRYLYITIKYLNSEKTDIDKEFIENPNKSVICNKDDILLARTGATGIVITDVEGVYHNNFFKVKYDRRKFIKKYLVYYLSQSSIQEHFKLVAGTTTIPDLNHGEFLSTKVIIPSIDIQSNIVNFLDKKLSEIYDLIADKEKLITLLKEKIQAIITEAVKKGLNPNVNMKDSGVEWIGEIPEQWKIYRLKEVCLINPNKSEINKSAEIEVTFIPMENIISSGVIDISITKNLSDVYNGYTYFKEGDIVVAKVTPCFENGNIAIAKGLTNKIAFGTTELHVLRANSIVSNKFIYYLLQSNRFRLEGISSMYGVAGLKRIPAEFIKNFKGGIPDIKEQKEIANFLDKKIVEINALKVDIESQIEKLKEYRQSLISEAVTGKIDVRDYFKGA